MTIKVRTDGHNWAAYNDEVDDIKNIIVLPGQLWVWEFDVGDGSWFLNIVSDKRRHNPWALGGVVVINKKETFMIVSIDDSGPAQSPDIDQFKYHTPGDDRYHVALVRGSLVWISHDLFMFATLVSQ